MSDTETCTLHIQEKFRFSDGTTVLVGSLEGEAKVIGPVTAALWVDGQRVDEIRILGERMPGPGQPHLRAVYTLQELSVDVKTHRCVLVWT